MDMRFFDYEHLREGDLRHVSAMVYRLAWAMNATVPDGAEKSAGMRKLLEAKDCFVRAALNPIEHHSFVEGDHDRDSGSVVSDV